MPFDTTQLAYQSLREIVSERTSSIVAWVGSGLSVAAGLPTWGQLKQSLLQAIEDKAASLEGADATKVRRQAEIVRTESNNWVAFQIAQSTLGRGAYNLVIREALRPAATAPIPQVYLLLWRLRIAGLLNANLDRLATKAFTNTFSSKVPIEFYGHQAGQLAYVLKGPHSFIANLHGTVEDVSTWRFTNREIDQLLKNEGYQTFIKSCLAANTLIFVGLSVDDVAIGGHLEALARVGIDTGSHFWFTSRRDLSTDEWAQNIGLLPIRYTDDDGSHAELVEAFEDLLGFVPLEDTSLAPPVVLGKCPKSYQPLPPPGQLSGAEAEEIRVLLNARAIDILSDGTTDNYDEYTRFSDEYDEAIYRAWYTSAQPGSNKLFDYTLEEEVGRGAFGRVYRAIAPGGETVAIKILLEEVRRSPELLQCFRRGVRSMRILGQHEVAGMVPYQEASEIPAFVVMDWVEGPDLKQAVEARQLENWEDILRIAVDLTTVVRTAHLLPERVLHRDLRPANIMLERFYGDDGWSVVVLDFDLSWHKDAPERSMLHTAQVGYLAPEQMETIEGVSTRHASVDSFGLGMTLFYVISHRDPIAEQHLHKDWQDDVRRATGLMRCAQWRSTPTRIARLIINATQHQQASRWDMSQLQKELQRLHEAVSDPQGVESVELVAEELAARGEFAEDYTWSEDSRNAIVELPSGVRIEFVGNENTGRVEIGVNWRSNGIGKRRNVDKWISNVSQTCLQIFEADRWTVDSQNIDIRSIDIRVSTDVRAAVRALDKTADTVGRAVDCLRFS